MLIISHTSGVIDAGIFSIASAQAYLLQTISKYGMRAYQVSDTSQEYSARDYLNSRYVTSFIMIFCSGIYLLYAAKYRGYSGYKVTIILCVVIMRLADAVEDVFHGMLQQIGRLDIASKALAVRLIITIAIFAVIQLSGNLPAALIISTVISILLFVLLTRVSLGPFSDQIVLFHKDRMVTDRSGQKNKQLLLACAPLAISAFLTIYLSNAPKYAIDRIYTEEIQAYYGYLSMPVFAINLLNGFIITPAIYRISSLWNSNKINDLKKLLRAQIIMLLVIIAVCMLGGILIGIQVLNILYHTDLSPIKGDFLILLAGGGLLAWVGMATVILTVMRKGRSILVGYTAASGAALLCADWLVKQKGITGAALLYTNTTGLLSLILAGIIIKTIYDAKSD